ncbi:unnamed protein product, partial [Ectocarpus fasciculatus]
LFFLYSHLEIAGRTSSRSEPMVVSIMPSLPVLYAMRERTRPRHRRRALIMADRIVITSCQHESRWNDCTHADICTDDNYFLTVCVLSAKKVAFLSRRSPSDFCLFSEYGVFS